MALAVPLTLSMFVIPSRPQPRLRGEHVRGICSFRTLTAAYQGGFTKGELVMPPITPIHYLILAAALFALGTIGVLTRRNVVIVLMSIELILNAVNLNLVAFSRLWGLQGQVFAIFVITDAAAEAAVGLGILIAFFRNKETVNVDEVDLLKW
jgi:NADH-quinone oxidoreductase subunit K